MRFRRGTKATVRNAYIADSMNAAADCNSDADTVDSGENGHHWSADQCITLEDAETSVTVENSLIENCGATGYTVTAGTLTQANLTNVAAPATQWLNLGTSLNSQANLAANGGTVFVKVAGPSSTPTAATPPNDGFFDNTANFVGAINNGANWQTTGGTWTAYPAN